MNELPFADATNQSRKRLKGLSEITNGGRDLFFVDERDDNLALDGVAVTYSVLRRIGARRATFSNCHFTQTIFEDCYFHNATFTNVDFTGCLFIDSNLDEAVFQGCNFRYARFRRTLVDPAALETSLPQEPNIRRDFLRELRANALERGRNDQVQRLTLQEIGAERQYHLFIITKTDGYWSKYGVLDKLSSVRDLLLLYLSDLVWGYGFKIGNLVRLVLVAVVFFTGLTLLMKPTWDNGSHIPVKLSFWNALYVAVGGLVGGPLSDLAPADWRARLIASVELGVGLILFGLFITAFYRRFAR